MALLFHSVIQLDTQKSVFYVYHQNPENMPQNSISNLIYFKRGILLMGLLVTYKSLPLKIKINFFPKVTRHEKILQFLPFVASIIKKKTLFNYSPKSNPNKFRS